VWPLFLESQFMAILTLDFMFFLTVKKRRGSSKGHDTHKGKPVKTGSPMFIRELRSRTFDR
jgi:hypothetical protein